MHAEMDNTHGGNQDKHYNDVEDELGVCLTYGNAGRREQVGSREEENTQDGAANRWFVHFTLHVACLDIIVNICFIGPS